jgi:hypothetical protein
MYKIGICIARKFSGKWFRMVLNFRNTIQEPSEKEKATTNMLVSG